MATGTTTINFGDGTAGGTAESSVDVTGQSGLTSSSYLEAFDMAETTANHTADDVRVDRLVFVCEFINATSFRIHAYPRIGRMWGDRSVRWVTA